MGGVGISISSTPSLQQSSDLEKTQAELRQTSTTADQFRRELDFLQKGGDPLDLKPGDPTSISFQSTSLKGHPEQFVTSEASSGRFGAPEPNSADNLMLLKESGDPAVLQLPKKAYKRRIRSHRPNRDPIRHASRDYKGLTHDVNVALKIRTCHLENELDDLPIKSDGVETESLGVIDKVQLTGSISPANGNTEINSLPGPTKILDSESSCTLTGQRIGDSNGNGLHATDLGAENNDNIVNIDMIGNKDGPKRVVGPNAISQDGNANDTASTFIVNHSTDGAEQNTCSQYNLKLATKEHEDSILEEARIIEEKCKRIGELSVRALPLVKRLKSHWDYVLEEMSWLANDFAQEHLWKVTAAAQISRRVAFASRVRLQQQSSLQTQKDLSRTLAEAVMQFWRMIQVKFKGPKPHCVKNDHTAGIQEYAMRFMEYNSSQPQCNATQVSVTLDIISDLSIMDHTLEDKLTQEKLFYTVAPGAIEAYRKAIDSHFLHFERTGTSMQEEVDTSCYEAATGNHAFEEEEGETNTYYSKLTIKDQKRRKKFPSYSPRSYEMSDDVPYMQSPSVLNGKRPGSSLNVTVPTKRVRTASRQRIISPHDVGTLGHLHAPNRTDASSADTNSFQDEHSILHGGTQIPNSLEAESAGDYEKQFQFDSMEVSNRPKKKKKGSTFEHSWQFDDQKDHSRRRLDTHQFDSNGSNAVSHMSNMSNSNKFMKLLARDRGRKVKALKTTGEQAGLGSPWSLFEDQALVVLVHDMGPNWELISDAINSTLQFKCIFRKSKECKVRHKMLMDMNTGDGADSAEDSGSSQPYPSTLPGIPEGSARQLFQRLQGPMEEDTLKSHFEKIIMLGQKKHYRRRKQNDNQDPKQLQQPHSSHAFSLSQVFPNNLSGGPVLTPLELCEAISSSPEVLPVGYQGLNHGPIAPMHPGFGSVSGSTSAPVSSNPVHASNLPSVREGRYGIPKTGSLSVDDQERMQKYGQMLSARNAQQSSMPPGSLPVNDRAVRMLPAGNGMGVVSAVNRNMKITRPGLQGIASPSSLHPGPGNSLLRPRDPMQPYARANSPHHFQGPPNHHLNPAYAMRLAKERQLQQQRLLQQQQQYSTSNPMMPRVQPQEPQLPGSSSPQNSSARSSSPPVKQQRPHPHQQAKLMKGSRGKMMTSQNLPTDFVPQKKTSKKTFDSADYSKNQNHAPSVVAAASSNHLQHLNQKLVNQKHTKKLLLLNRKVNKSDQTTSMKAESPTSLNNSSQPSTPVTIPNATCNDANVSETPVAASVAPADDEPSNHVEHDVGVQLQQQQTS